MVDSPEETGSNEGVPDTGGRNIKNRLRSLASAIVNAPLPDNGNNLTIAAKGVLDAAQHLSRIRRRRPQRTNELKDPKSTDSDSS